MSHETNVVELPKVGDNKRSRTYQNYLP